jgi:hypothetical protein
MLHVVSFTFGFSGATVPRSVYGGKRALAGRLAREYN